MPRDLNLAVAATILAIAITTTMDATGYAMFSALPLLPLTIVFWAVHRLSRGEIGLVWGPTRSYLWALAYPIAVLGATALIAFAAGAVDTTDADWNKTFLNMALMSTVGVIMAILTEEGFFRGYLWGALKHVGWSDNQVLVWTTLAFTVWHISAITLDTGFDVPAKEVPVFLVNATLIGAAFGLLRLVSGSIVVASVCHAVWNSIDYPLFGFGEHVGALGIQQTHIFGPEVGFLGIVLNTIFVAVLWRSHAAQPSTRQSLSS